MCVWIARGWLYRKAKTYTKNKIMHIQLWPITCTHPLLYKSEMCNNVRSMMGLLRSWHTLIFFVVVLFLFFIALLYVLYVCHKLNFITLSSHLFVTHTICLHFSFLVSRQFSCDCNYSPVTHNKTPVYSTWGLLRVCVRPARLRLNLSSELRPSWNNI